MEASVSLAPFLELGVTVGGSSDGFNARITQRVPELYVNASEVSAVNRDCSPVGDNDFESFAIAFIVDLGMNLTTIASIDLDLGVLSKLVSGLNDSWEKIIYNFNEPLMAQKCAIIADDGGPVINARRQLEGRDNSLSSLAAAATGTLVPAASALPTFNIPKIESYYSANGHLPTNVNYGQMMEATTVPDNIKKALQSATKSSGGQKRGFGVGGRCGTISIPFLVVFFAFL